MAVGHDIHWDDNGKPYERLIVEGFPGVFTIQGVVRGWYVNESGRMTFVNFEGELDYTYNPEADELNIPRIPRAQPNPA